MHFVPTSIQFFTTNPFQFKYHIIYKDHKITLNKITLRLHLQALGFLIPLFEPWTVGNAGSLKPISQI